MLPTEKILEIKRNNQHLLNKLLYISKSKNCAVNQKNLRIDKPVSKSLNNTSHQKEARRIDKENQKIMYRIMNAKPCIQTSKLKHDYEKNHLKNKRIILKKQGLVLDDLIKMQMKVREGRYNRTALFPKIAPMTSTSVNAKLH